MTKDRQDYIVEQFRLHYRTGEWHARLGLEQDFRCAYCGTDYLGTYDAYRSAELDHLVPSSADGSDDFDNRVVCCRVCNLLKGTYVPSGDTREERILDAKRYVTAARLEYEAELTEIRKMVREPDSTE